MARVRERTILSDRRLSVKLVPTFADRECHMVSITDSYGRILGFLGRSHYFFFQVDPQLYSKGRVPDPLLRKSGSTGNRIRTSGSVARNSDHYGYLYYKNTSLGVSRFVFYCNSQIITIVYRKNNYSVHSC
jgi:hypothetical protein